MAIKLTIDGAELAFDTVAEYNEFARTNAEIKDEGVAADEITTQKDEIKLGDTVEVIGNTHDYHGHKIGEIGVVTEINDEDGDYEVNVNGFKNYVLKQDVKKIDSEMQKSLDIEGGELVGKVVKFTGDWSSFVEVGTYRVDEYDSTDGTYHLETLDGESVPGSWTYREYLIVLDDEAEYSAQEDIAEIPEGYEKVSFEDAKEGDYFLALTASIDIEVGEKYELVEDYEGDLEFDDDGADARMLKNRKEDVDGIVIRKIAEDDTEDAPIKKGDIVTGTSDSIYAYTTDKALMEVTDVFDGEIEAKILKSVDNPDEEGHEYSVFPEYFVKTTEEEFDAKHGLSADKDDKADKYERISFEDAKVGDYWVADEEGDDITAGKRYLITKVYVDDDGDKVVNFDDDEGDERERYHFSDNGHVERKAARSESVLVVGAKYRVTGGHCHSFDVGTEVTFTGEYGELSLLPKFKNGLGHVQCLDLWEVERINDEETAKFKVGDKVRVAAASYHHLEDGYIGEVLRVSEVSEHIRNLKLTPTPYYVGHQFIAAEDLTLVTDEEESKETAFKVGDKVRVKAGWLHNFADGTVGEIIEEFGEDGFVVKTDDPSQQSISSFSHGEGTQTIPADYLTLVTDDEVQTQSTSFKKGDRVVVTVEGDGRHFFKKGTVGTVIDYSHGSGKPYVQADSMNAWIEDSEYADKDDNAQYISECNLEAFTSKHIEVGAKYEVIERAERYSSGRYAEKGAIIEVKEVLSDGDIHVDYCDGTASGVVIIAKEAHKLRKVEDDEVQTQETEFEKGDIIRMKEDVTDGFGDKIKANRLAEVEWFPGDNTKIAVRQRKGKRDVIVPKSAVELVAKAIK